jgi:N-acetylmuramoyl-L-alanine amidase
MLDSRRCFLAWLALCLLSTSAWAGETIVGIRLGLQSQTTRIVVDLSTPTAYRVGLLASPNRLYVELPTAEAPSRLPHGRGLVGHLALTTEPGLLRLVAYLSGPVKVTKADLIPGTGGDSTRRLVVDVAPASAADFAEALGNGPIDSSPPIVLAGDGGVGVAAAPSADPPAVTLSGAPPAAAPPSLAAVAVLPMLRPQDPALSDLPAAQEAAAPASSPPSADSSSPATASAAPDWPRMVPLLRPGSEAELQADSGTAQSQKMPASGAASAALPATQASLVWPVLVPILRPGAAPAILPLIYLDPGHGGPDPGTIGHSGTYEKDVTLAMAEELQRQLLATGRYRVKLTRERDRFVALRPRFEMARQDHADMFISLHADADPFFAARGASVYTLSETASDAEAEALAAKENKADLIDGVDLSHQNNTVTTILIDLAQRETKNRSAAFAELLVQDMGQSTLMLRNSHRFAGFAVLKAPDIPSVLIELGYLSDAQDEAQLISPVHRAKLAGAMLRAIDGYYAEMASGTRS